jgi:hypothetical protein
MESPRIRRFSLIRQREYVSGLDIEVREPELRAAKAGLVLFPAGSNPARLGGLSLFV